MTAQTVLISGIGIAGPTLAYWLARAGYRPTLVEQAPTLRQGGYVVDFWGLGYDIAERMGISAALEEQGYHMREMRIVGDRGRRIAGFGTAVMREVTGGRFVTVRRSDLARLLFEKAATAAEALFGDEIIALEQDEDGCDVELKNAGRRRFDLVIGADGLHSRVRRLVAGPQSQFEHFLGYGVAAFEAQGYRPRDEGLFVFHSRPGQMLSRLALRDDHTMFLFVFADDGAETRSAGERSGQKALLRRRYAHHGWESGAILDALDAAHDVYFDRVSQIRMPSWSKGRVALAGDAAFCASLMAGQGTALAMTAAYVLAGELGAARGGHGEAFARYETRLRSYVEVKQKGAERFSAAFAPRTALGIAVRNLVVRATALPGVARYSFGREMIDTLDLPAYAWG